MPKVTEGYVPPAKPVPPGWIDEEEEEVEWEDYPPGLTSGLDEGDEEEGDEEEMDLGADPL